MLDAPELQDDFYLNLVDWSSQNVLSVGLGSCVYLWSACTSQVTRLCDLSGDGNSVTSVAWNERVSHNSMSSILHRTVNCHHQMLTFVILVKTAGLLFRCLRHFLLHPSISVLCCSVAEGLESFNMTGILRPLKMC